MSINSGADQTLDKNSDLYARSFEHWIGIELKSYLSYRRINNALYYWQSKHQHEVDFIIDDQIAIEVKATNHVSSHDLKNLKILQEEKIFKKYYLVSQDRIEKKQDDIYCIHWKTFIEKLWKDEVIS